MSACRGNRADGNENLISSRSRLVFVDQELLFSVAVEPRGKLYKRERLHTVPYK